VERTTSTLVLLWIAEVKIVPSFVMPTVGSPEFKPIRLRTGLGAFLVTADEWMTRPPA
jgi:hypothetical protein